MKKQGRQQKKYLYFIAGILVIFVSCCFFRHSILLGLGNHLIREEKIREPLPLFILSGNAYDRGGKAFDLFKNHQVLHVYCTGSNISNDLKAIGILKTESQVTVEYLQRLMVPDSFITNMASGTSTMEERDLILNYCLAHHLTKIAIITSKFHTHRVYSIFHQKFLDQHIQVYIEGAKNSSFDESVWWHSEEGLIAFAVEYMKLGYYWLKY